MENSSMVINGTSATVWTSDAEEFQVYRFYYERQILAIVFIGISFIGIVGNIVVISAVPLSKKLRTVTNVFVVNLSASDLLACLFLPWEAVAVLSEEGWPLPRAHWLCWATSAILITSTGCSVINLALIAIYRWIGITRSVATKRRVFTSRNITFMVAFSWALSISVNVILPSIGFGELGYEPRYSTCSWVTDNPFAILLNIIVGGMYFLNLIIIAACYTSIFRYVLKTGRRMARHDSVTISGEVSAVDRSRRKKLWKRQIAVTKNLVYIVLAYIICLTPFLIAAITVGNEWSIRMTPYTGAILFVNSCVNPIIYATSHPDFKEAFRYMVRCKFKEIPQSRAQTTALALLPNKSLS